jgi:hypothetical protein
MQMIRAIASMRWAVPAALIVLACGVAGSLAGCGTTRPAPVEERMPSAPPPVAASIDKPLDVAASKPPEPAPKIHVVQKGETLIAIALQHGLDYKELAAWNNLENANVIQVGRELVGGFAAGHRRRDRRCGGDAAFPSRRTGRNAAAAVQRTGWSCSDGHTDSTGRHTA